MKTFAGRTSENLFDLETQNVLETTIDMVELTDEDLEKVSGSCWGCGFGGWGWGGFGGWGWGGFSPWFGGFGWGGFSPWFGGWGGWW
jgi:hypothetical protein